MAKRPTPLLNFISASLIVVTRFIDGSTQQLHFDHVIPVSRGGANSVANIHSSAARATGPRERGEAAARVHKHARWLS
jgi:5-methylcytosine-specific restriction endonuclease McrA